MERIGLDLLANLWEHGWQPADAVHAVRRQSNPSPVRLAATLVLLENSALLCERHHTKVHSGFRVERPPDGRWRTYRPDGTEILLAEPVSS